LSRRQIVGVGIVPAVVYHSNGTETTSGPIGLGSDANSVFLSVIVTDLNTFNHIVISRQNERVVRVSRGKVHVVRIARVRSALLI